MAGSRVILLMACTFDALYVAQWPAKTVSFLSNRLRIESFWGLACNSSCFWQRFGHFFFAFATEPCNALEHLGLPVCPIHEVGLF